MSIAYLGPAGSFSHQVVQTLFEKEVSQSYTSIRDVLDAYAAQEVDLAFVPVENSVEGSVHETIDWLYQHPEVTVVAEVVVPISQQLLAVSERPLQVVFSHPQALAQSRAKIRSAFPEVRFETMASTAAAARYVADHPQEPYAAVASLAAAREYHLEVLLADVEEMKENQTRFWLLGLASPDWALPQKEQKMTLALTLPENQPGSLYQALSVFAWRKIDLSKIESRPLKTALGEYFFIVDVDPTDPVLVQFAMEELEQLRIQCQQIGLYPVYTME